MAIPSTSHSLSNQERRRRERPVWWWALGASVALHLVVFLSWPATTVLVSPFSAAGPRAADDQAASGSLQVIDLARAAPPEPLVPPPVPTITVDPVVVVEFDDDARVQPSEVSGAGLPDLAPPGTATGEGAGDGGTSDEGRFTVIPPEPRAMILPTFADELRERGAEVWVWVDVDGRVVPDSTRLQPPTSDRSLNRRLREEASDWRFLPARRGGEAVASWYNYRIRTGRE